MPSSHLPPRSESIENHRGRCIDLDSDSLILQNEIGIFHVPFQESSPELSRGDLVEVSHGRARILTPNRTQQKSFHWLQRTLDPRRVRAVSIRTQVENGIREFFRTQGFHETRTPLLVPCPGMEPHIRPFPVTNELRKTLFLPTSPEFAMKRLLVGGLERIFQICSAFRDEPHSITHRPEFSILEWYRAYAGYEEIMKDTEELFAFLAIQLFGKPSFFFQGQEISVKPPWPRLKIRDLFQEIVNIDLTLSTAPEDLAQQCKRLGLTVDLSRENWDDLYFKIWLNLIEPKLPQNQAVFVTRYPASQAALSVIDQDSDGSRWARRFEVYAGGLELGNAFEELTDPLEQRKRFQKDMDLREKVYGSFFPKNPLDESFLHALTEGMPPSGGIAMGVDRIVMLLANEPDISYTSWMDPSSLISDASSDTTLG